MSAANTLISRLALGLAFLAGACGLATSSPAHSVEKPIERILIGIDYAFPPHQWLDENGEPRGFDVDLIRAVADAVGLGYEAENTGACDGPDHQESRDGGEFETFEERQSRGCEAEQDQDFKQLNRVV